ncbi:type II secretion system protein [Shewanella sp. A14]
MQKQQGFTLIELVVVIIILGILAVTAAPKFINLQGDARASALAGVRGAIQGANTLIYSKAALAGVEKSSTTSIDIADTTATTDDVDIAFGYIVATETALERALDVTFDAGDVVDGVATAAATTGTADWIIKATAATTGTSATAANVEIWQAGAPSACSFTYTQATAESTPVLSQTPDADNC